MQAAGLLLIALFLVAIAALLLAAAAFSLLPSPLQALAGYWWEAASIAWGAVEALAVATEAWCRIHRWWVAAAVVAVGVPHTAREFVTGDRLSFGPWLNFTVSPRPRFRRRGRWWSLAPTLGSPPHRRDPETYTAPVTRREELVTAAALVVADVGLALAGALHSPGWWAAWAAFRLGDTGCHWTGWLWSRLRGPGTRSSLATAAVGVALAPLLIPYWWAVVAGLGSPLTYARAWVRARKA